LRGGDRGGGATCTAPGLGSLGLPLTRPLADLSPRGRGHGGGGGLGSPPTLSLPRKGGGDLLAHSVPHRLPPPCGEGTGVGVLHARRQGWAVWGSPSPGLWPTSPRGGEVMERAVGLAPPTLSLPRKGEVTCRHILCPTVSLPLAGRGQGWGCYMHGARVGQSGAAPHPAFGRPLPEGAR